MASNEDGGCFDFFSNDYSDWDANPAASIYDKIADGETLDSAAG